MSSRTGRGSSESASIPATSACWTSSRRHSSQSPCAASSRSSSGGVALVQAIESPDREELVDQRVVARHRDPPRGSARSRRIASSVRDFTVPSGSPVRSAICDCERPSKYIRSITSRCSSGSAPSAVRTSRARREVDRCEHVVDRILHDAGPQSRRLFGPAPLCLLPSHGIDRPVVNGAHEPGADGPLVPVVAIRVPPDGEERLLHDLLRDLGLTDQPEGEGVGNGRVSAEELAERLLVSGDDRRRRSSSRGPPGSRAHGALRVPIVIDALVIPASRKIDGRGRYSQVIDCSDECGRRPASAASSRPSRLDRMRGS